MIEHLVNWITAFISVHGYPGVFGLMALESACIPIPSEAIMGFAGAQISAPQGSFHPDIYMLAFIGAAGNLFGSIIAYWVGSIGGRPFLERYGKFLLIRKRDLKRADAFFQKYGEITVLRQPYFAHCPHIYLCSCRDRQDELRALLRVYVRGALPFCYLLAWAGVKLGQHWEAISAMLHKADMGISVILVLLGIWLWHHLRPEEEDDEITADVSTPGTKSA